ncbi:MAG: hypothetical protein ACOX3T_04130 [Bdellovibrionota bacterium]
MSKKKLVAKENVVALLKYIDSDVILKLFIFTLKLLIIKPMLLQEIELASMFTKLIKSENIHPLSLAYDRLGKMNAYHTRVNGALISLIFFHYIENKKNFLLDVNTKYMEELSKDYDLLKQKGIEGNEIFSIMFSESINQHITSTAGSKYEERILNLLISIGIDKDNIKKMHDKTDKSTEYDFFFKIDNKTFGISAKRTLRERYKQFLKTSYMTPVDVLVEITLGLDLSFEKAKTITSQDVYIFIADEVYNSREDLRSLKGVLPTTQISLKTFKSLGRAKK